MQLLRTLPFALFRLPLRVRLCVITLSFLISLSIYWATFPVTRNGGVVVIPIALAAWMLRYRGAFIGVGITSLAVVAIDILNSKTFLRSQSDVTIAVIGLLSGLFIAFIVSYLRHMVDLIEAARQKVLQVEQEKNLAYAQQIEALQAEQKMSLAYEQQRQLNELKDQFIVNVNHELRTPLTGLYGYADLLSNYGHQMDADTQARFLGKLMDNCQELLSLVNTVLDATEVGTEARPPQLEHLLVAQVVHEAFEHLDPYNIQEYRICRDIPDQLIVWGNRQYVLQVLRNLLSNAFKYSPKETTVVISATLEEHSAYGTGAFPQVCISVKDAGPGIPPDALPLLFGKFVRLKRDLSGPVRGTGLGLYISKQLVEAMNGHIWVESSGQPGEGSRFCFTLPAVVV